MTYRVNYLVGYFTVVVDLYEAVVSLISLSFTEISNPKLQKDSRLLYKPLATILECRELFKIYIYSAIHGISFIRDLCTTYYKRAIIFVKSTQNYEKIVKIHLSCVNLI